MTKNVVAGTYNFTSGALPLQTNPTPSGFIPDPTVQVGAYHADSATGSDSNNGILVADGGTGAKLTAQAAIDLATTAGDQVVLKGTFTGETESGGNQTSGLIIKGSGASGNMITIMAHPDGCTIDANNASSCFGMNAKSYVRLHGFIGINGYQSEGGGVRIDQGDNNIFTKIHFSNLDGGGGSNVAGFLLAGAEDCVFEDCKVNNVRVNGVANGNAAGVILYAAWGNVFRNMDISDAEQGIYPKFSPDAVGEGSNTYTKCEIYNVTNAFHYNDINNPDDGGYLNDEISYNIIYDADTFIDDYANASANHDGMNIHHNTVTTNNRGIESAAAKPNVSNHSNIYIVGGGGFNIALTPSATDFSESDFNCYGGVTRFATDYDDPSQTTYTSLSSWQTASSDDASSFTTAPTFINAAGGDYRQQSGSSCLGTGKSGTDCGALGDATDTTFIGSTL